MILRAAMLASGTGFILAPRRWLGQLRAAVLRKVSHGTDLGKRSRRSTNFGQPSALDLLLSTTTGVTHD